MRLLPLLTLLALSLGGPLEDDAEPDHSIIKGMTISCQTWGKEWGTDGFGKELDRLGELGTNWVAIHPYASIRADGSVRRLRDDLDPEAPPGWLARPLETAHAKGFSLFVKPHLAYWGSPFRWRGDIDFAEGEERTRFWREYSDWIVRLASVTTSADAFCVGTELDRFIADESEWRALIKRVREVTDARLTYAANWDQYQTVPFWDALDAIGVQAYFPLSEEEAPTREALLAGWEAVLTPMRALSEKIGKPIVFTELGYAAGTHAAIRPWEEPARGAPAMSDLQVRCLSTGLEVLARERAWLRGAFLWKWFVGKPHRGDGSFYLDHEPLRASIRAAWAE